MKISIAYAVPGRQVLLPHNVPEGTTIRDAILSSGILEQLPQLDLSKNKVGIFSKVKPLDTVLNPGDRIEIYFPVTIDPKKLPKKKATEKAGGAAPAEAAAASTAGATAAPAAEIPSAASAIPQP